MKKGRTLIRNILSVFLVFTVVFSTCLTAFAAETNENVTKDTSAIVQLKVAYTDDAGNKSYIQEGTGFLINNSTVITCDHVVRLSDSTMNDAVSAFGKSAEEIKDRLSVDVSVLRDVTITATIQNESKEMDYAILNLSSQLYDRTYLSVRSSSTVQQTESVYALGFPGEVQYFQDVNTYTSDDVTISNGLVNKVTTIGSVNYIQSSAKFLNGNSGGPMVDNAGNVIGICQGSTGSGFDTDYYYAIAIDQLTKTLDALGIEYTKSTGTPAAADSQPDSSSASTASHAADSSAESAPAATPAPVSSVDKTSLNAIIIDAQKIEVKDYDKATGTAFSAALEKAQKVLANDNATQAEVDSAVSDLTQAKSALNKASSFPLWIVIAAGGAAVLIVVIVLIVLLSSGKKKKTAPVSRNVYNAGGNYGGSMGGNGFNQVTPQVPPTPGMPRTNAGMSPAANETSVLNAGSDETTVLGNSGSTGTLTRAKTGEKVRLNTADFTIGKEVARVNYCIMDNTSVSRIHARFTNRSGAAFVTDLGSTNGTFVNGRRLAPNTETRLNEGDKITIADEKFTYSAN